MTLRLPSALRGQCSPLEATCYSPPSPLDPDLPETALLPPPLCCSSPFLRCLFLASPHEHAEVPSHAFWALFLRKAPWRLFTPWHFSEARRSHGHPSPSARALASSTTLCRIELTSLPLGSLPQLWRPMGRSDVFKDPHSFSNTCFWLHHDSFCLLLSGD